MGMLGRMILAAMSLVNSGEDCLVRDRNKAGLREMVVSQTRTAAGEVGEKELLFSPVRWRGVLCYSVEGNQRLVCFIFKSLFQEFLSLECVSFTKLTFKLNVHCGSVKR